jgi:hypothetical protein
VQNLRATIVFFLGTPTINQNNTTYESSFFFGAACGFKRCVSPSDRCTRDANSHVRTNDPIVGEFFPVANDFAIANSSEIYNNNNTMNNQIKIKTNYNTIMINNQIKIKTNVFD